MKQTRLKQMQSRMIQKLGSQQGRRVSAVMEEEYHTLCSKDAERSPDLLRHLHNNIFPVAAAFRALLQEGMSREEAADLASDAFLELMEKDAALIQRLCKIPGVYRLIPKLFGTLMPKLFKADAGFAFQFYIKGWNRVKFDMLRCPYYEICQEIGCLEVAPVFCTTDDL